MFATCSWPSLCEQSELQCRRRNRRLCGPVQISAARALPLTFDILILNTLPYSPQNGQIVFTITYSTFLTPPPTRKHFSTENSFKKSKFSVLWLAGFENLMYFCTVFHGIRFKVSEDWLSGDNQFFCTYTKKQGAGDVSPQVYRRNRIIRQLKFLKTSLQATQPPYFEIATLHHVLPRHAGRVWLACRQTVPY